MATIPLIRAPPVPLTRVIAPAGMALRSKPTTAADRLALLPVGAMVQVIQTLGGGPYDAPGGGLHTDWHQVRAGEREGFVAAAWLESTGSDGAKAPLQELRGVWIASHHHSAVWQTRETLARALDQLVDLGWNTIFPAAWNQGHTAWPSAVMERQGLPRQDPVFAQAGLDPLELAVDLGKERGLTVIPWLEYGFAAEPLGSPRPLLAAKPAWAARDRQGQVVEHGGLRWLNALDPAVQEFVGELFLEVVERYGVDGVQGDDHIALPLTGSHDPATLARYREATGQAPAARDDDPSWSRFRCQTLSRWVREIGERIHQVHPGLRWCLSPAPLPTGRGQLMQDSASWLREGAVDLLLPQLYRNTAKAFAQVLEANLRPLPAERRWQVLAGLALRAKGQDLDADTVLQMVRLSRLEGLAGVALFHHTPLTGGEQEIAQALWERGGFDQVAVMPHSQTLA